jgi:hypothetical protein
MAGFFRQRHLDPSKLHALSGKLTFCKLADKLISCTAGPTNRASIPGQVIICSAS